jgi:hypothetical protein
MSTARLALALDRIREAAVESCPGCTALRADHARVLAEHAERLEALEQRPRRRDSAADAALVGAIAATFGGAVFSVSDLRAASDPELRAALEDRDGRRVGLQLRRIARHQVAGYTLHRIKRANSGQMWAVTCE